MRCHLQLDRGFLASGSQAGIKVRDVATGKCLATLADLNYGDGESCNTPAQCLAKLDGGFLASGSGYGESIKVWAIETWEYVATRWTY